MIEALNIRHAVNASRDILRCVGGTRQSNSRSTIQITFALKKNMRVNSLLLYIQTTNYAAFRREHNLLLTLNHILMNLEWHPLELRCILICSERYYSHSEIRGHDWMPRRGSLKILDKPKKAVVVFLSICLLRLLASVSRDSIELQRQKTQ